MPRVAEVANRSLKADCTDFTKICFSSLDVSEMFMSGVSLSLVSIRPITTTTTTNFESKQSD